MLTWHQWRESLLEPNNFTNKDPANQVPYTGDEDESEEEKNLPMGMKIGRPTAAFPVAPAKRFKARSKLASAP